MDKPNFAVNLSKIRNDKGLTQQQVAEMTGFSRGRLNNYEQGTREPDLETLTLLADFYGVTVDNLLGKAPRPSVVDSERGMLLPVIGKISMASNSLIYEEGAGQEWADDADVNEKSYWLQIKDDCMMNEGIRPGDMALVCEQPDVENGDLAVVILEANDTLRRVYKKNEHIVLQSANPEYPPCILSDQEKEKIRIVGKVKATKRRYI